MAAPQTWLSQLHWGGGGPNPSHVHSAVKQYWRRFPKVREATTIWPSLFGDLAGPPRQVLPAPPRRDAAAATADGAAVPEGAEPGRRPEPGPGMVAGRCSWGGFAVHVGFQAGTKKAQSRSG